MTGQALRQPVRSLLTALRFLTILPLPGSGEDDSSFFSGALFFFTITGLIIGIFGALLALLLLKYLPPLVAAGLLAVFLSLVSGFLHLDGLADSCDGLLSSRPAEKCLEIMRDSRIGVMGAASLCTVLLLKTVALASLAETSVAAAMIIAPAGGRTAIIFMMALVPYARKTEGLGLGFYAGINRWTLLFSAVIFIAASVILCPSRFILICSALILTVVPFSTICRKKLGGATGDTLGAVCELSETVILVSFSIIL